MIVTCPLSSLIRVLCSIGASPPEAIMAPPFTASSASLFSGQRILRRSSTDLAIVFYQHHESHRFKLLAKQIGSGVSGRPTRTCSLQVYRMRPIEIDNS